MALFVRLVGFDKRPLIRQLCYIPGCGNRALFPSVAVKQMRAGLCAGAAVSSHVGDIPDHHITIYQDQVYEVHWENYAFFRDAAQFRVMLIGVRGG